MATSGTFHAEQEQFVHMKAVKVGDLAMIKHLTWHHKHTNFKNCKYSFI